MAFVFHKKERARGTQRGGTTAARTWLESTAQFLFWGAEVPVLVVLLGWGFRYFDFQPLRRMIDDLIFAR